MKTYWFDTRYGMIEAVAATQEEAARIIRQDRGIEGAIFSTVED